MSRLPEIAASITSLLNKLELNTDVPGSLFLSRVSVDQSLSLYIRLAAHYLRWQDLWSYWAIAMVLTRLGCTITLLKPPENGAIHPFYAPKVVMLGALSRLAVSNFTVGDD